MTAATDFLRGDRIYSALLPWVIGVMVFLLALCLAAVVQLASVVEGWRAPLRTALTVQITNINPDERDHEATAVRDALLGIPGIKSAVILGEDETAELLEPWLGDAQIAKELPVPRLVDVTLADQSAIDLAALEATIIAVAPSARVDTHEAWLDDLMSLARAAQFISAAIVIIISLATIAVVVFATRAGLAAQHETVAIVHLIGARDSLIARAFQNRFLWVGVKGGCIGLGLGLLAFVGVYGLSLGLDSDYLPVITPQKELALVMVLLPVFSGILTMFTARFTVLRSLKRML